MSARVQRHLVRLEHDSGRRDHLGRLSSCRSALRSNLAPRDDRKQKVTSKTREVELVRATSPGRDLSFLVSPSSRTG